MPWGFEFPVCEFFQKGGWGVGICAGHGVEMNPTTSYEGTLDFSWDNREEGGAGAVFGNQVQTGVFFEKTPRDRVRDGEKG
jgi:hypothetical protein